MTTTSKTTMGPCMGGMKVMGKLMTMHYMGDYGMVSHISIIHIIHIIWPDHLACSHGGRESEFSG